jgi:LPS-assembly protein
VFAKAKNRARALLLAAALLAVLAGIVPTPAGVRPAAAIDLGDSESRRMPMDPKVPWDLEADRMRYDQAAEEYVAEGRAVISKQGRRIEADRMRFNRLTNMAYAEGHVVVTMGEDVLSGEYLELDMESELGQLDNGVIFIKENNYHIQGDLIQKTGKDSYWIDKGRITTCDGPLPDWVISGRDVNVKEDGAGSAWHATLFAREIPVAYFPYLRFPARGRQTGFLMPQFGWYDKKGFSWNQPFFWAIDDQSDATFYLQYMSERGWKPGIEYRYYLTREAFGAVMFDFLHDDKVDDGSDSGGDYGYDDSGGVFLRPNHDRWWFRMSHYQPLPYRVEAKLDIDRVSDQDYLQDFKTGYMGFLDTEGYFNKFFGRELDDYNDPVRVSRLLLSRSWSGLSLNAENRFYDDVRKGQNWKEVVQKLPVVRLDAHKQPIGDTGNFYNLFSEYTNFYQQRGSRVQRIDLWPRLYRPFALPPYLTIEPSVGLRETLWNQYESDEADSWSDDRYFHRELFDTRLSLFTNFYRIFDVDSENLRRIKHTVRPELGHTYVPEASQENLPNIDSRDRIENRNRVTYALTNTFTSKTFNREIENEEHPRQERKRGTIDSFSDYDYRDFLRLKVSQYYDFADHEEPFSPITARLDLFPGSRISLDGEVKYNVHDTQVESYSTAMTIWAREKDRLFIEYRYDREFTEDDIDAGNELNELATTADKEKVNSLFTELRIGVTDRLSLIGSYEYDFEEEETNQYGLGFIYQSQCWSIEALYSDGAEDTGIGVRIRLHGIGEFGL